MKIFYLVIIVSLFTVDIVAQSQTRHSQSTMYPSYKSLTMAGYQGWFHTPKEGQLLYPDPAKLSIDMWPYISEYEKTYETGLKLSDGTTARFFSADDKSTVDLHFKWMKEYGLDGVFMQLLIGSKPLQLLPAQYYSATFDKIVIPAGSFFGKLRVDLTDAFFADPLATGLRYVIPLRITDAQGDSILSGQPRVTSPDPRKVADWVVTPKNFVLFGIKYINPTHGVYLLRVRRKNVNNELDVVKYSTRFIDDNEMTKLSTSSLTDNFMSTVGGTNKEATNAKYSLNLKFDKVNKSVVVSQRSATTVSVNGTGKFFSKTDKESESYNGKKHRTIYLDYTYIDGVNTYQVNDSLVFVNTDIKFEEFAVVITP